MKMKPYHDLLENPDAMNRRSVVRLFFGAGAALGLGSCSTGSAPPAVGPAVLSGILVVAARILRSQGKHSDAKKVEILAAVLALTSVVLYYYRANQAQKTYVIKRRATIDRNAARVAPKNRYVAVQTTKPTHRPKKTATAKGKQVQEGVRSASVAGKTVSPPTKHLMIYDTRRKTLKSSNVYEVSRPKRGEQVTLGGTRAAIVD